MCIRDRFILEYDVSSIVYLEAYGKKIVIHTDSPQLGPVSYTHLDVYKRQVRRFSMRGGLLFFKCSGIIYFKYYRNNNSN